MALFWVIIEAYEGSFVLLPLVSMSLTNPKCATASGQAGLVPLDHAVDI